VKSLRLLPVFLFLYACGAEPPPPRSVDEFKSDRVILDATLARCNSKGSETDFEKRECNNANKAVEMLWRQREMELKAEREKQFDAKREALRLRQEREEALRRADEAEQRARKVSIATCPVARRWARTRLPPSWNGPIPRPAAPT
jgi:hypothetical protein